MKKNKGIYSRKKYRNVFYVIYDNLKNIGNFKQYLIDNSETIVCYHFPHGYSNTSAFLEIYKSGKLEKTQKFYRYHGESNIIKNLLYYLYFQYIIYRYVPRGSYIIVDNPIFCVLNIIPSFLKQMIFIYWIGDFYPNNSGFMKIYNALSDYYNKSLQIVWYVSPPIKKIFEAKMGMHLKNTKKRMLVPLGMKRKAVAKHIVPHLPLRLGYIGVIREQQGLDLIFGYLKKYEGALLEIIGEGYQMKYYKSLAKKMKISKKVRFNGYVEDLNAIASTLDIGIALYENNAINVSRYCEPTKIKNYIELGLPVITTKATYFYKELQKNKAGIVVNETLEELDQAIRKIKSRYPEYKKGVNTILDRYEYTKYYDKRLGFMKISA